MSSVSRERSRSLPSTSCSTSSDVTNDWESLAPSIIQHIFDLSCTPISYDSMERHESNSYLQFRSDKIPTSVFLKGILSEVKGEPKRLERLISSSGVKPLNLLFWSVKMNQHSDDSIKFLLESSANEITDAKLMDLIKLIGQARGSIELFDTIVEARKDLISHPSEILVEAVKFDAIASARLMLDRGAKPNQLIRGPFENAHLVGPLLLFGSVTQCESPMSLARSDEMRALLRDRRGVDYTHTAFKTTVVALSIFFSIGSLFLTIASGLFFSNSDENSYSAIKVIKFITGVVASSPLSISMILISQVSVALIGDALLRSEKYSNNAASFYAALIRPLTFGV